MNRETPYGSRLLQIDKINSRIYELWDDGLRGYGLAVALSAVFNGVCIREASKIRVEDTKDTRVVVFGGDGIVFTDEIMKQPEMMN